MKPLLYLQLRVFINNIKNMLHSPKKLIPALLICFWIVQALFVNLFVYSDPEYATRHSLLPVNAIPVEAIWSGVFAMLALVCLWVVYSALAEGLLSFTPSQVDFLFPTPVNRRYVLALKLAGDYARLAFYAGMFLAFTRPILATVVQARSVADVVAVWLAIVLLLVSVGNISHTLHLIVSQGEGARRLGSIVVKGGAFALLLLLIFVSANHYLSTGDIAGGVVAALRSGVAQALLAPVAWCANVVVGSAAGASANPTRYIISLCLLAVASGALLMARPENYYEPSLGLSARMARLRAAARTGGWGAIRIEARRRSGVSYASSFPPPFGRGAVALLWKGLVVRARTKGRAIALFLVAVPVIAWLVGKYVSNSSVGTFATMGPAYMVWVLSMMVQHELRAEMTQANILKSMPLSGTRVVTNLLLSSWVLLAIVVVVMGASIRVFIHGVNPAHVVVATVGSLSLGFSCMAIASIPALMYPSHDQMQQIIPNTLSMLLMGIAVLPTAAIIAVAMLIFGIHWAYTAAALIIVNAAIAWAALTVAGGVFNRFDPTSD